MTAAERGIAMLLVEVRDHLTHGRYGSAEEAATHCAAAAKAYYGTMHPAYASAANNLSVALNHMGKHDEAIEQASEALKVYEKVLGNGHASTAATLANLGVMFTGMARRAKGLDRLQHSDAARSYLEQALSVRSKLLPAGDPQLAVTQYQLAAVARLQGKAPEAESLLRESMAALRTALGPTHRLTATAVNNWGVFLKEAKRYEEARAAYEEALETRVRLLGDAHPDTVAVMYNLGELMIAAGDEAGASALQTRILKVMGVSPDAGGAAPPPPP